MESGLTAGSEHQRDLSPGVSIFPHFQVNFKFRRYWSHNTVQEGSNITEELRFCPECLEVIEHDERGYPACIKCGSIFPLPPSHVPKDPIKLAKHKAANMRKFINRIKVDESYLGELHEIREAKHTKGGKSEHKKKKRRPNFYY